MGNKLRKMIENDNTFEMSVSFKTQEDKELFANALKNVGSSDIGQRVPIPISMDLKKKAGGYLYPVQSTSNITDFWVYPHEAIVEFTISVDGVDEKILFERREEGDDFILKPIKFKAIDITMSFSKKLKIMKCSYSTHPEKADTVTKLIDEYKRFFALMNVLFTEKNTNETIENVKKYFQFSIRKFIRLTELGEVLKIDLTPKKIVEEDYNNSLIYEFYLLLVKKKIIRQNEKINNIKVDNVRNIEEGQELCASVLQSGDLEIFGEHRSIYMVNCIFGALVNNVKTKANGEVEIFFKDTEKNPMYRSYSAFLNKTEAEAEMKELESKLESYINAKYWEEQIRDYL